MLEAPTQQPSPTLRTYAHEVRAPRLKLPAGSCDAHVHVFGPQTRFAYAPRDGVQPQDAPKETLFALHQTLGIERCVVVQSMVHGLDNRVVEDVLIARPGRYLGVALVAVDVADAELERLAQAGFRGVRFNFMPHLGASASLPDVCALTHRLAPLGMHLQVHFESSLIHEIGPYLAAHSRVAVVIDHMARVDAALGAGHPDFQALLQWLRHPLFRVKVSGVDRIDSRDGPAHGPSNGYRAGCALARHLVQSHPDRCLWGSDWPHPNHTHVPDDAALVDALEQIAPDAALRQRLLVDNPMNFYRFAEGSAP